MDPFRSAVFALILAMAAAAPSEQAFGGDSKTCVFDKLMAAIKANRGKLITTAVGAAGLAYVNHRWGDTMDGLIYDKELKKRAEANPAYFKNLLYTDFRYDSIRQALDGKNPDRKIDEKEALFEMARLEDILAAYYDVDSSIRRTADIDKLERKPRSIGTRIADDIDSIPPEVLPGRGESEGPNFNPKLTPTQTAQLYQARDDLLLKDRILEAMLEDGQIRGGKEMAKLPQDSDYDRLTRELSQDSFVLETLTDRARTPAQARGRLHLLQAYEFRQWMIQKKSISNIIMRPGASEKTMQADCRAKPDWCDDPYNNP